MKLTRLSCHSFRSNQVWLWLSVTANNLGNLWRRLGMPTGRNLRYDPGALKVLLLS